MSMFDTEITTLIREDGSVEQKKWLAEDALQAEEFEAAQAAFLFAEKKFQKIAAQPEVVSDPKLNAMWWDALENVYERERILWRLFLGPQPDIESNKLYAKFRKLLLEDKSLKANA